jgi:hypothetical protein
VMRAVFLVISVQSSASIKTPLIAGTGDRCRT